MNMVLTRIRAWIKRPFRQRAVFHSLRTKQWLPMEITEATLSHLTQSFPDYVDSAVFEANKVLSHQFSLLGIKNFTPIDHSRDKEKSYIPIDWHWDPRADVRFPTGFFHKDWNMLTMCPQGADIKYPWELGRCQHLPLLGQAWQLTADEKYALEIAHQCQDFMEANPVGIGVNWVCTMDVAIRAANWAIALSWVKTCVSLDAEFWRLMLDHLLSHGHFIWDNLENHYEVTSNHFLSNVVGLFYVAAVFSDLPEGKRWQQWCVEQLEREIDIQVLEDGADFESSIPYHRLVTELFLSGFHLALYLGLSLSTHYQEKLKTMLTYLLAVLRPDGLMPQVGDADDGRLHILTDYGRWNPQDARHLFAPAAALLGVRDWATYGGRAGLWEAAWWGLSYASLLIDKALLPDIARLFPQAGHAVSRYGPHYLLVTNAKVGTEGFGNHKHNDQLSFEYHCNGEALIVDPGSFVYTGDPAARNQYRGTAMHNTVMVDNIEQNEMNPEWLFRLFEKSHAECLDFESTDTYVRYRGVHQGYTRLDEPCVHQRTFEHQRQSGKLTVVDQFEGRGQHALSWHFHLAPHVRAEREEGGFRLITAKGCYQLRCPDGLTRHIQPSAYSPGYGVEIPCLSIVCDIKLDLSFVEKALFIFSFFRIS